LATGRWALGEEGVSATRSAAIAHAVAGFDDGSFRAALARRIALPTESQRAESGPDLERYIVEDMIPAFHAMGFSTCILTHSKARGPFLVAERIEDPALLTVFGYGHGDTVNSHAGRWREGAEPFRLSEIDGRWYGRGIVDNKGQHSVNMAAMAAVLAERGRLGFNARYLIEMGEECGSPGLREVCLEHAEAFRADLLVASDGPRLAAQTPTLFLGARGALAIDLRLDLRTGDHHSGNWGGLISNAGILLAHAITRIVDANGRVRLPELVPKHGLPESVRRALTGLVVDAGPDGPQIEPWWGEPGLSAAEKVFGWCNFEVLAFETGDVRAPTNAIPSKAVARCQLRFTVDVDADDVIPAIRRHLAREGLGMIEVSQGRDAMFGATRLDPDDDWVRKIAASMKATTGKETAILPNLGGALPNDIFADVLGLKTIWIPHSYPGCSQHAPNEHVPAELFREALAIMAGVYWDLGEGAGKPV
jgi:acetylornithine deacetylase/succinyl-diaminopimelate desuccinylase-like protein